MPIAIDTETELATNAVPVPRLVSVSIAGPDGVHLWPAHRVDWPTIVRAFAVEGAIFANAPFDVYVLLRAAPWLLSVIVDAYENGRIHDVATREKLIDIAAGLLLRRGQYNLGSVAKRRAGIELDKNDPWRKRYAELLGLEVAHWPEAARQYAIADACATYATYLEQDRHDREHGCKILHDAPRQARKHIALYSQTLRGLHTDQNAVDELERRLDEEITTLQARLLPYGLTRVEGVRKLKIVRTPAAAQLMVEDWCASHGLARPLTDSGATSTARDEIVELGVPPGHPLRLWGDLTTAGNQRTKSVPVFRRPHVRTRYDECKETGRTGSSKPQGNRKADKVEPWEWIGSNFQNLPTSGGYRECLVPPPGRRFAISDYGMAELVALGQICLDMFGRSALADLLRSGKDPHSAFGARVLGIPIEQFDKHEHADARKLGKAWNFGKWGGMGQARFIRWAAGAYGIEVTPEQERAYSRLYKREHPEIDLYFKATSRLEGYDGTITIVQPRSGRVRGRCSFPDACNTRFQGLTADAAGDALWLMWRAEHVEMDSVLYAGPPVDAAGQVPVDGQCLFVHDEIVTVCRPEKAEAVREAQEQVMIKAYSRWCPDVPVTCDSHITERFGKF